MIFVLCLGVIVAIVSEYNIRKNSPLKNENEIVRNEWGVGDKNINLIATLDDHKNEYELILEERDFTKEELLHLADELRDKLSIQILNGNNSLVEVNGDLLLPSKVENYPFFIRWYSSDEDIIANTGKLLCRQDCKLSHKIKLIVKVNYEDFQSDFEYEIKVVPKMLSDYEEYYLRIQDLIMDEFRNTKESHVIYLPKMLDGKRIIWKEKANLNSLGILLGSIALSILVGFAAEYDEKSKIKKSKEALASLYPSFVERLKLYMISGMSVRKAFFEIEKDLRQLDIKSYEQIIVELSKANNCFNNGVREESVYEMFGSNCGGEFKKLSFLLIVNLKQGNDRMLALMDEEVTRAYGIRKDMVKQKTDEAGVKLLFPMMLMLVVVMILIMIPAYFGLN